LLLSPLLVWLIISLLKANPEEDPAGNDILPARSMIMPAGKMGNILYKIPAVAILNEETTAVIRLAFEGESKAQLPEVSSGAGYQSIRISEVREVRLLQPDTEPAFDIHPDTSVRSANEALAQHDWTFRLTPLREGTFTLTLRLAVVEIVLGTERKREINLQESIRVIPGISGFTSSANTAVFKPSGYLLAGLEYEPEAIPEEREPAKKIPDTDLPEEKKAASNPVSTKNQESRDPDIPSTTEVITKPQTDQNIHTTLLSHLKVKIIYADRTRGVKDEVEKILTNKYRIFVTADKLLNAQMESLNRISYSNNRKEHALALQKELGAKGNFELRVMRSVEDDFDLIIMLGIPYQK